MNSSHIRKAIRAGLAVLAIGAMTERADASAFLVQVDDLTDALTVNLYQDGSLIQSSPATSPETFSVAGYAMGSGALLANVNVKLNIYEPDGVTLSDTWQILGSTGQTAVLFAFHSDIDGVPLTALHVPPFGLLAPSVVETGDWQTFTEFDVSTGDHWKFQFRSEVTEAPEPATIALLGLSLAGLGVMRRRRAA